MIKWMFLLLGSMLGGNAYTQQTTFPEDSMLPYRNKAGLFGYVNEHQHILIEPQYKSAGLFNGQGYAVVQDSTGKYGVIDQKNNPVFPFEKNNIRIFTLNDFTLVEAHDSYYANYRFWNWRFLPGLNFIGGGSSDKRLFDTQVKRNRTEIWILNHRKGKISSKTVTASNLKSSYFKIIPLDSNQVLIDDRLYDIRSKGARLIASQIKAPLDNHLFAQHHRGALRIIDQRGRRVSENIFTSLDSLEFRNRDISIPLSKNSYHRVATAYQDRKDYTFIYPDFSKPLPRRLDANINPSGLTSEEIIGKSWLIYSIPKSPYFLFMGNYDQDYRFYFLDTEGNWHENISHDGSFTVIRNTGDIIWPGHTYYIPPEQIPDTWKVQSVKHINGSQYYKIDLRQEKQRQQGIWDFEHQRWLIPPKHYLIYTLGTDHKQWAFQSQKDSLWGVLNNAGKVILEPQYNSISPTGMVRLNEQGTQLSFYIHLPDLQELREK